MTLSQTSPKLILKNGKSQVKQKAINAILKDGAIKYSEEAYEELHKKISEGTIGKEKLYEQNYIYTLNNIIYYVTKSGDIEKFESIKDKVDELLKKEQNVDFQGRFYDTLGWYYLRDFYLNINNGSLKRKLP